ncbi:MAG TPA: PKD domain-containing protein [Saprospiraceae bacterium]|nr:PKD domain-containing protein [Saprospiraceae bacterium]
MLKIKVIIVLMLHYCCISAQQEDNVWLFGTNSVNLSNYKGYAFGNSVMDFSNGEPRIFYDSLMTLDFEGTNASICNGSGKLMMYTNGMQVHNGSHQVIKGADTIAYGSFWELFNVKDYPKTGLNWLVGFNIVQGSIVLPWPGEEGAYAFLYHLGRVENSNSYFDSFMHSKIFIDSNYQNSKILFKDSTIMTGKFIPGMIQACRHGNGRDWWLVNRSIDREFIYLYLFDPSGIHLHKEIRINLPVEDKGPDKLGQLYFSPDGSKMGLAESILWPFDTIYIELYEFDRIKGDLYPIMKESIKNNRVRGTLAFSPSSQYMYISNHFELFQYDVTAQDVKSTRQKIGDYDGYVFKYNEFDVGTHTELGCMALGPDGRIYIVPESSNRFLHTIEQPDEEGLAAGLVQRKHMIPTSNHVAVPNFPHYRLGPVDGSIADTLGINNNAVARFRYESDTTDFRQVKFTDISYYRPETWHWDFGDGNSYEGKKPGTHQYESNGSYKVCLTVSNENGSHTSCKDIHLGVTSTNNNGDKSNSVMVQTYPNPVQDAMVVTIHDYLPEKANIKIYDITGKEVLTQKVYFGWNHLNVASLPPGVYLFRVTDKAREIGGGKFVKS